MSQEKRVTLNGQWQWCDGTVEAFEVNGMMAIPEENGVVYVTREQAAEFFGFEMIEHKNKIFKNGIGIFATQFCQRDRDAYIAGMVHERGYIYAAKEFFKHSAYLTAADATALLDHDIIPEWMGKIFVELEREIFGETFYDKR